jgi:hypothetical protein
VTDSNHTLWAKVNVKTVGQVQFDISEGVLIQFSDRTEVSIACCIITAFVIRVIETVKDVGQDFFLYFDNFRGLQESTHLALINHPTLFRRQARRIVKRKGPRGVLESRIVGHLFEIPDCTGKRYDAVIDEATAFVHVLN